MAQPSKSGGSIGNLRTIHKRMLAPNTTRSNVLRAWWVTSRMEYLPDAIVHVALPLALVLRHEHWNGTLLRRSGWGLLVWLLGHWVGSSLNCVADCAVDRLDEGGKARLSKMVDSVGAKSILVVNSVEILIATILATWLAVRFGKPTLPVFWLIGLVIASLYSFEPVRLKKRGWLNPLALAAIVYLMPLLFIYHLLSQSWNTVDVAVLTCYTLQMLPMFLMDEVSDCEEDRAMGVETPCVLLGRVRVAEISIVLYATASACFLAFFVAKSVLDVRMIVFLLAILAYGWVIWQFARLRLMSAVLDRSVEPPIRGQLNKMLKDLSRTPRWLVATSIAAIAVAFEG